MSEDAPRRTGLGAKITTAKKHSSQKSPKPARKLRPSGIAVETEMAALFRSVLDARCYVTTVNGPEVRLRGEHEGEWKNLTLERLRLLPVDRNGALLMGSTSPLNHILAENIPPKQRDDYRYIFTELLKLLHVFDQEKDALMARFNEVADARAVAEEEKKTTRKLERILNGYAESAAIPPGRS